MPKCVIFTADYALLKKGIGNKMEIFIGIVSALLIGYWLEKNND